MNDWLDDLAEFAAIHVATACQEWRRFERKRPTPADIRKLAFQAQQAWIEARTPQKAVPAQQPEADGYVRPRRPLDEQTVRDNWKQIRFWDLTHAERDLFRKFAAERVRDFKGSRPVPQALRSVVEMLGIPEAPEAS